MIRKIRSTHSPVMAQDGAGVKLKRLFPVAGFDRLDPFLLLDHFGSDNPNDYLAGFPLHPHRGIETVTYMLSGQMAHRDSTGRSGVIKTGDVQWMRAGRGILHEELPQMKNGKLDGFQLWVNMPAKEKMTEAQYQEFTAKEITTFEHQQHTIKLISGKLLGKTGSVQQLSSQTIYADIHLKKGELRLELPLSHNVFLYCFEGSANLLDELDKKQKLTSPNLAVLSKGDRLILETDYSARILLVAGKKLDEPVARSGPFVMNTEAEIAQTWREVRNGTFPSTAKQESNS